MSLSSTGYCFANYDFEQVGENLGAKLINVDKEFTLPGFSIISSGEIKENKDTKKLLTKVRKLLNTETNIENRIELRDQEHHYETERIEHQVNQIKDLISKYTSNVNSVQVNRECVDYVLIEDYNYHGKGSVTQLAELRGFLKISLEFLRRSGRIKHIRFLSIPSIKKLIGMNGHADKELIMEGLKRFGLELDEKENDKADAIAINISGFYAMCHSLEKVQLPLLEDKKEMKLAKTYLDTLDKIVDRI